MKHIRYAAFASVLLAHAAIASVSVKDDRGQEITLAKPAQRIISLAPHATEDLFAIGAGKLIVGAVSYSDYPPEANKIERIGGYNGFDLERIRALKPDLIVAWQSGNPAKQLAQIETLGLPVFYTFSKKLEDVPTVMERLGVLTAKEGEAQAAASKYRSSLAALEKKYAGRKPVRVFYQVWDRPLMTINREQIISDAMRLCGGVNVFAALPALVPTIDDEAVLAANPDVIITSGEPGVKDSWLNRWKRWPNLKANKHLYILPKDLLSRMGPRLVDGTEKLCEAIDKAR